MAFKLFRMGTGLNERRNGEPKAGANGNHASSLATKIVTDTFGIQQDCKFSLQIQPGRKQLLKGIFKIYCRDIFSMERRCNVFVE